jgi:hypothetical protein
MQNNNRPIDVVRPPALPSPVSTSAPAEQSGLPMFNAAPIAAQPQEIPLFSSVTAPAQPITAPKPKRSWLLLGSIGAGAVILLAGGILLLSRLSMPSQNQAVKTGEFNVTQIPLSEVATSDLSLGNATSLKINGQLEVTNSVVFTPSLQPSKPTIGQLYYDKDSNQFAYYNGQQFQNLGGTNTTSVTNVLGSGQSGVLLQTSSPGVQQTGNINISGTAKLGTVATTIITSNGGTLYVNPISATSQQEIAEGTPASVGLKEGSLNAPGPGWDGEVSATKVTLGSVGGVAKSISVVLSGGSPTGRIQLGIYDDDGNIPSKPGNLLAASAIATLTPNGTTTVTIPNVTLASNGTYWLALKTDDPTVGRPYNSGSKSSCFVSSGFGFMPAAFTSGCFPDDNAYAIYLNYLVGAGTTGSLGQAQFILSATGQALFQNTSDSTSAFQIQNSAGTSTLFNVDTVNGRIGIGRLTPGYKLDIAGGDVNLSGGRSLRFGGSQALSASADGSITALTNFTSGGTVSVQAANFVVQDADASHRSLAMASDGSATFSNKTNSATAFQVQNATGTALFTADTAGMNLYVGNPLGSDTPVILHLANKNTAGDPATGTEGGTYYNSTLGSFRCYRTGFWQNCADIEPQHSFSLYDDFMGGQTSFTGAIGSLGWTAAAIGANGSLVRNPTTPTPSADRPGVLQIQTPASSNQGTTLLLADTTGGSTIIAKDNNVKTSVAVGAATGNVIRVGLHTQTTGITQPVSGVWWEADPAASANWRYCYGNGATATCAASAVAIASNTWATLEIRVTAIGSGTSAATFVINNTPLTVSAATIDTTNRVSPALSCYGTTGAAQTCTWDYYQFTGTTSGRR